MNKKKILALILIICIGAFLLLSSKEIVISGSMKPTINKGDIAFIIKHIEYEDIKKGDIISYNLGKTKVLHRVIAITDNGLITKGDHNDNADFGIVTKDQVNGKYLFSVPLIGYLILLIKKYKLVFLCIIVIFIVISRKKEVRKNE